MKKLFLFLNLFLIGNVYSQIDDINLSNHVQNNIELSIESADSVKQIDLSMFYKYVKDLKFSEEGTYRYNPFFNLFNNEEEKKEDNDYINLIYWISILE
jgi:hypothetical protein